MATCKSCNGWGVVFYIATNPPSTAQLRMAERTRPDQLIKRETVCLSCGGYGTRAAS